MKRSLWLSIPVLLSGGFFDIIISASVHSSLNYADGLLTLVLVAGVTAGLETLTACCCVPSLDTLALFTVVAAGLSTLALRTVTGGNVGCDRLVTLALLTAAVAGLVTLALLMGGRVGPVVGRGVTEPKLGMSCSVP